MVSKTRKQRQRIKSATAANGGSRPPAQEPKKKKSVHEKKTRPAMKRKLKWRLGLESSDIYEGFEERSKGGIWVCPNCRAQCRVVGYCVDCATGVARTPAEQASQLKKAVAAVIAKKATPALNKKKLIKKAKR
eukprot:GILI01026263.1.p1 GENE.GILI01026263.1~~GILI01026263.1.p1  ORF type:complete len:133 (-),score=36.57 GILI01026263.1:78-476(-)